MTDRNHEHFTGEMPGNHTYQMILIVVFLTVWIVDSFVLRFTTVLWDLIPIWIPILTAIAIFAAAAYFINASQKTLFESHETGVSTGGVYSRVRHPMYLGMVLVYLALATVTLSLAALAVWLFIFVAYDVMASYEERLLKERFGGEYIEYQKEVRKWLPG
ncbi:MAG: methyltransferase family protein [Candidatus Thorarchaeota archaeon]